MDTNIDAISRLSVIGEGNNGTVTLESESKRISPNRSFLGVNAGQVLPELTGSKAHYFLKKEKRLFHVISLEIPVREHWSGFCRISSNLFSGFSIPVRLSRQVQGLRECLTSTYLASNFLRKNTKT